MADTAAYIEVAGLRTWHEVTGEGEPVALLHGAFGGATSFFAQTCPSAGATCARPTWRAR